MKFRILAFTATIVLLWGATITVGASDQATVKDSTNQPPSAVETAQLPGAVMPEMKFDFDPVVDGIEVAHAFVVKNTGKGPLAINKVKTGWGCTVASYTRQIPAGGEGTINIKVNTSGFGGKTLKKNIDVFTNDPANAHITLKITGRVLHFARMEPAYARLVGLAGSDIKKVITITREKAYPFQILEAKARNGKDIAVDVQEFSKTDGDGYILTIENKKTAAGRYADKVILTTDSKIKPTITVPVYGQIISAAPQPEATPLKKSASDG